MALFLKNDFLGSIGLLYFITFYLALFIPYAAFGFIGAWYLYSVLLLLPWLIVKKLPNIRAWLRPPVGLDNKTRIFMLSTVICSTLALSIWFLFFKKNSLTDSQVFQNLLTRPAWFVFLVIVPLMALINAIAEEVFFRGVMQDALSALSPNLAFILTLQASAFAVIHHSGGFPDGKIGYGMTFIYGLALGWLKFKSKSLRVPILVHTVADYTIFCLVLKFS